MTSPQLHILGAGQHGRVVADAALACWPACVLAFWDDAPELQGQELGGIRVRGALAELAIDAADGVIVAIGDNHQRLALCRDLQGRGISLASVVHPAATVSPGAALAAGVCVLAGAVVQTGARLGDACIVNTLAAVEHDCVVEAGTHIAGKAYVGAGCVLGTQAMVGAGAILLPGTQVGAGAQLGAGALLTQSLPAGELWYGQPARFVRTLVK